MHLPLVAAHHSDLQGHTTHLSLLCISFALVLLLSVCSLEHALLLVTSAHMDGDDDT